jgi:hypothetical protein
MFGCLPLAQFFQIAGLLSPSARACGSCRGRRCRKYRRAGRRRCSVIPPSRIIGTGSRCGVGLGWILAIDADDVVLVDRPAVRVSEYGRGCSSRSCPPYSRRCTAWEGPTSGANSAIRRLGGVFGVAVLASGRSRSTRRLRQRRSSFVNAFDAGPSGSTPASWRSARRGADQARRRRRRGSRAEPSFELAAAVRPHQSRGAEGVHPWAAGLPTGRPRRSGSALLSADLGSLALAKAPSATRRELILVLQCPSRQDRRRRRAPSRWCRRPFLI